MNNGLFFDRQPGRIDACFSHCAGFDYMRLRMRYRGAMFSSQMINPANNARGPIQSWSPKLDLSLEISSVFCPFRQLLRFLEAITTQVDECAFEWDAEGPVGRMHWRVSRVGKAGWLTVSWHARHRKFEHRLFLSPWQTVNALYSAFRRFVESPQYDPLRYESLEYGESLRLILPDGDYENLTTALANLNTEQAVGFCENLAWFVRQRICGYVAACSKTTLSACLCGAVPEGQGFNEYERALWLPPEWDTWSMEARRHHVENVIYRSMMHDWHGGNLRAMRSAMLEQWIEANQPE